MAILASIARAKLLELADSPAEVRRMSSTLLSIFDSLEAVIAEAEGKQLWNPVIDEWLESIRDVCYDVMDVSDELILQEAKKVRFLGLPRYFLNPLPLRKGHHKMQEIKHQLEALLSDSSKLGLSSAPPSFSVATDPVPETSCRVSSSHMHGRNDEMGTLIDKLVNEGGQEQDIPCISIVGMAGIGKTLLAQLVYDSAQVREYFELRSWVWISSHVGPEWIAKRVVESLTSIPVDEVDIETLQSRLARIIEGKRCLFVMDGVWIEDPQLWQHVKELFTSSAPGSRILITTQRLEGVASVAESSPTNIMCLNPLSAEDCWLIFRGNAFGPSIDEANIKKIYDEIGSNIFQGVPLNASVLGGALRGTKSIPEWQAVLESLSLRRHRGRVIPLTLSYYQMPSLLRQCLLLCSIANSSSVDKLIKLWMAQGYLASHQDEMERGGCECLQALSEGPFFYQIDLDEGKWSMTTLQLGYFQRFARGECRKMNDRNGENVPTKLRHCTLDIAAHDSLPVPIASAEKLHTLILSAYSSIDPAILSTLLSHLRRVRALVLSNCSIKEIPLKVGELLHLRYLDLSDNHDLEKLPRTICNLLNLQTLNLNGCYILRKLPKGIGKLTKLRHLQILWTSISYLPKGVANLTSLRTLSRFFGSSVAGSRACSLGDLEKLNNIQGRIIIEGLGAETGVSEAVKAGLKNKGGIRGLELWFSVIGPDSSDQDVLEALEAPPQLESIGIFCYRGELFPNWITALENLTHLKLADCSKCNILPPLWKLPSLESLEIKNMPHVKKLGPEFLGITSDDADGGDEGFSSTVAFPKLEKLLFEMLKNWEEWVGIHGDGLHANIMPSLTSLSIKSCAKIRALPDYIKSNKNLIPTIEKCPLLNESTEDPE